MSCAEVDEEARNEERMDLAVVPLQKSEELKLIQAPQDSPLSHKPKKYRRDPRGCQYQIRGILPDHVSIKNTVH